MRSYKKNPKYIAYMKRVKRFKPGDIKLFKVGVPVWNNPKVLVPSDKIFGIYDQLLNDDYDRSKLHTTSTGNKA